MLRSTLIASVYPMGNSAEILWRTDIGFVVDGLANHCRDSALRSEAPMSTENKNFYSVAGIVFPIVNISFTWSS